MELVWRRRGLPLFLPSLAILLAPHDKGTTHRIYTNIQEWWELILVIVLGLFEQHLKPTYCTSEFPLFVFFLEYVGELHIIVLRRNKRGRTPRVHGNKVYIHAYERKQATQATQDGRAKQQAWVQPRPTHTWPLPSPT
jgi:hypothetical protein